MRNFLRPLALLGELFSLAGLCSGAFAEELVVAVFDIEDRSGLFKTETLQNLNEYFYLKLTQSGFKVIPRQQIKERLTEQKTESYKSCYDESCQIELGRELAAQKVISGKIIKLADSCQFSVSVYDLKKAVAEAAKNYEKPCDEKSMKEAVELVAVALASTTGVESTKVGYGFLKVTTNPEHASIYLDKKLLGTAPLNEKVPAGRKSLVALAKGYLGEKKTVDIPDGDVYSISFELKPMPPYSRWGHITFWSGVALSALGITSAFLSKSYGNDYRTGDTSARDKSEMWAGVMYGSAGAGLSLLVTGTILWIMGAEPDIDDFE